MPILVATERNGGRSWQPVGLAGRMIMTVTGSPAERDVVWAGTGPSEVSRSGDAGNSWQPTSSLETLSSSSEWSFPPRPERNVAIDPEQPDVVVVSASSGPYSAYVAGRSDGRLYRRLTRERWERVRDGWPEPASTVAPLLCASAKAGELWAADEGASTARMTARRVGSASPAIPRRRSIRGVSRRCGYVSRRTGTAAAPEASGRRRELTMIRKLKSGQYRLYSRKVDPRTGRRRNLGTFATRAAAEKHERAVQFFKRQG